GQLAVLSLVVLCLGAGLLGRDVYLRIKGALAGRLVERALAAHLADGAGHRPWAWADFEAVARLEAPRLGVMRPVLTGASGESLAFGLGHVDGTAWPGAPGNLVLVGHRDSWASFMGDLRRGDALRLVYHGGAAVYDVVRIEVVQASEAWSLDPSGPDRLTLITCHPVDGVVPTHDRHVITCSSL
ncbi:sortase, partial [bacterium]|nr:sortase [bacterium]